MNLILKILIYLSLCTGARCVQQMSWLPCQFADEYVFPKNESYIEMKLIHKDATLQFGHKGDTPVNPKAITFLVTGSKLDLQRYIKGVEAQQLDCELHRFSTDGLHGRWPVQGATEYDHWFTCTLKHTQGLFIVTVFLRLPSDQPPSGLKDYHSWTPIADSEILTTTAAMVMKTQSPSVKAGLSTKQKLDCQFAVDHKEPNMTVEWHFQHRGERVKLFSHNSRTGQTQGSGVGLRSLAGGDASYNLHSANMSSEGTYVCSVSVMPLFASLDINLTIEEAPHVFLNVGPTLFLQEGQEHKVVCNAERFYPLDVEIVWFKQNPAASGQRVGGLLPEVLKNILLSSHRINKNKTSLSAFFHLQASLRDSGKEFVCSVSHQLLRVPIRKSFILTVTKPSSWIKNLTAGVIVMAVLGTLYVMLRILHSARKRSMQKKPF